MPRFVIYLDFPPYIIFLLCFDAAANFSRTFSLTLASTREFVNVFFQQITFLETCHVEPNNFLEETISLVKILKTTNLLFGIANIDMAKNTHWQDKESNIPKSKSLFNQLNSSRASLGSSGILDRAVPGSNSTAVSSLFLCHFLFFKVRKAKNFKVFQMFGDGLRTCAPVKSIVTSQEVTTVKLQTIVRYPFSYF